MCVCECVVWHWGRDEPAGDMGYETQTGSNNTLPINLKGIIYEQYNIMTDEFGIGVGLHQGSALSPYLFDLIMDVISEEVREDAPWSMLFADDIVLVCKTKAELGGKLSRWKKVLEDRGFKISRTKTEYVVQW